jgi:hypothetical protein
MVNDYYNIKYNKTRHATSSHLFNSLSRDLGCDLRSLTLRACAHGRLSVDDTNAFHEEELGWIKEQVDLIAVRNGDDAAAADDRIVILTHHAPTPNSVNPSHHCLDASAFTDLEAYIKGTPLMPHLVSRPCTHCSALVHAHARVQHTRRRSRHGPTVTRTGALERRSRASAAVPAARW